MRPILSTLVAGDDPHWSSLVHELPSEGALARWLWVFWRASRGRDAVILKATSSYSEQWRDLLAAASLRLRPLSRRPVVIMSDATIEPGSAALAARLPRPLAALLPWLSRRLISAADSPAVLWCVLSRAELTTFPQVWGVPAERMRFTPFCHTLWGGGERLPTSDDAFVFAGGDSLRDYDLLAAALPGTGLRARVASRRWSPGAQVPDLTAGPVDHETFLQLLRSCRALVLPLRPSTRSTGQQTYLNAMALGKPVIVTDAPGVRDYITDGVTGRVVTPTAAALHDVLVSLADPRHAETWAQMGRAAQRIVLTQFTEHTYRRELLKVAGLNATTDQ